MESDAIGERNEMCFCVYLYGLGLSHKTFNMLRESALGLLILFSLFSAITQMLSMCIWKKNMINGSDGGGGGRNGGGNSKTDVRKNIKLIGRNTKGNDVRRMFNLFDEDESR